MKHKFLAFLLVTAMATTILAPVTAIAATETSKGVSYSISKEDERISYSKSKSKTSEGVSVSVSSGEMGTKGASKGGSVGLSISEAGTTSGTSFGTSVTKSKNSGGVTNLPIEKGVGVSDIKNLLTIDIRLPKGQEFKDNTANLAVKERGSFAAFVHEKQYPLNSIERPKLTWKTSNSKVIALYPSYDGENECGFIAKKKGKAQITVTAEVEGFKTSYTFTVNVKKDKSIKTGTKTFKYNKEKIKLYYTIKDAPESIRENVKKDDTYKIIYGFMHDSNNKKKITCFEGVYHVEKTGKKDPAYNWTFRLVGDYTHGNTRYGDMLFSYEGTMNKKQLISLDKGLFRMNETAGGTFRELVQHYKDKKWQEAKVLYKTTSSATHPKMSDKEMIYRQTCQYLSTQVLDNPITTLLKLFLKK